MMKTALRERLAFLVVSVIMGSVSYATFLGHQTTTIPIVSYLLGLASLSFFLAAVAWLPIVIIGLNGTLKVFDYISVLVFRGRVRSLRKHKPLLPRLYCHRCTIAVTPEKYDNILRWFQNNSIDVDFCAVKLTQVLIDWATTGLSISTTGQSISSSSMRTHYFAEGVRHTFHFRNLSDCTMFKLMFG